MRHWKLLCAAVLLGMVIPKAADPSVGYQTIQVKNSGTLTGTITLNGPVPPPRVFPLALYPFGPYCEKNQRITDGSGNVVINDFEVGPEGGLKDVVVVVEGVTRGKPFNPIHVNLFSRGCEFIPFVSVVQNDSTFTMTNEDPILHNSQLYQAEKGNVILNVPIPPNSVEDYPIHFQKRKRIYKMICGMHEFMQTWGYAVTNPYYALTGMDGTFRIDKLPPGKYKVTAWRPYFKPVRKAIVVAAGQTVGLDFEFESSHVVRPQYESQKKFRIGK